MSILHDQFLEVIAVADEAWRVCDGRVDPADAEELEAVMPPLDETEHSRRIGAASAVCEHFDCLDAALEELSRRLSAVT